MTELYLKRSKKFKLQNNKYADVVCFKKMNNQNEP